jgi:hypothetical protein
MYKDNAYVVALPVFFHDVLLQCYFFHQLLHRQKLAQEATRRMRDTHLSHPFAKIQWIPVQVIHICNRCRVNLHEPWMICLSIPAYISTLQMVSRRSKNIEWQRYKLIEESQTIRTICARSATDIIVKSRNSPERQQDSVVAPIGM